MAIVPSHGSPTANPKALERVIQVEATHEDQGEQSLRPDSLSTYLGQEALKQNLSVTITAARQRGEALDHLLFYGPPGLGKTTLSMLIAHEMGTQIKITSAPALERARDIAGLLLSLQPGDILFIDEIHRLNRITEEMLYPAMEDFMLDITIGKGQGARIKRLPLKRFTLIGATTRAGAISAPLRARFGLVQRLNFYTPTEMQQILLQSARILNIALSADGALAIGQRSRGTPRVANRLLKRVRDYAQIEGSAQIDAPLAQKALAQLQVDALGLDETDRLLLETLIRTYQGGPAGVETLAAAISEDAVTIEEIYEPFLMQAGLLQRTQRGRIATPQAFEHLGFSPSTAQLPLFD
jgi:Holliday junction DNA helicase RuvB